MSSEKIFNHLRAGFPAFWLTTNEPERVKTTISKELSSLKFKDGSSLAVLSWDALDGDPMGAFQSLIEHESRCIIFLYNFHWYVSQPKVIQTIQNSFPLWANSGKAIVVVSPKKEIPLELEKEFTTIDLPMPDEKEIEEIINFQMPENDSFKKPSQNDIKDIVKKSKGLTKRELQNVYNLSFVQSKSFDIDIINDYRSQAIKKSGIARVLKPNVGIDDVVGYDVPKKFVLSTINNPESKGILFVGPPGVGKTMLAKAICKASGKLGIIVDVGALFSKFQGETDANVRKLIDLATALGDCYMLFDEIEKQFAGVNSTGELDSGVTARALGTFLEFFENRPKGCYVGATSNDVSKLPPEYIRAGRWDTAPIYMGLPSKVVQNRIMKHYTKEFKLEPWQCKKMPTVEKWTGAEIKQLCRNAKMLESTLADAKQYVKPMYVTMGEKIKSLETWAKDRCINADSFNVSKLKVVEQKRKVDI